MLVVFGFTAKELSFCFIGIVKNIVKGDIVALKYKTDSFLDGGTS